MSPSNKAGQSADNSRSFVRHVSSVCFECRGRCVHELPGRTDRVCGRHLSTVQLPPHFRRIFIERMFVRRAINNNVGERDEERQPLTPAHNSSPSATPSWRSSTIRAPLVHYSDLCQDILKYIPYEYIRREAGERATRALRLPVAYCDGMLLTALVVANNELHCTLIDISSTTVQLPSCVRQTKE